MTRLLRLALSVAAVAALTAACSTTAPPAATASGDVTITAKDNAFGQTNVTAPAGRPFTIGFTNQEASPHNVTIARDSSFSERLFEGEVVQNRAITYNVPALAAGSYPFRCDVHPFMVGTITAQ